MNIIDKKNFLLKLLFPFMGIASFIWFLIRVIPKPSRASYPCMRVAAPLASSFVLWLLGMGTSFVFLKRARAYAKRSLYIKAAISITTGALVGGMIISLSDSPPLAATQPNVPIGIAKGINPGRVVWVYDSTVSNWKGLGDGHWWEGNHTNQTVVDQMLSKSLRMLTGASDDAKAWDTLFKYYNNTHGHGNKGYVAGEKIAIKLNLSFCNFFPEYCCVDSMTYSLNKKLDYMNTSPQMARALLRQLVNIVGVKQSDISIGDPTAYYPNEYYDSCYSEFTDVNYIDHAGKFNRTKVEFSNAPIYWSCRPENVKQDYVPKHYFDASYIINLANMKSHMGGGITLCAKNHYGSLIRLPADNGYYDLHTSLAFMSPQMGSYRALVDLMGYSHLGGKTLLYLIDGLYAGNHNQDTIPHKWDIKPFNGGWTSSIFTSQDPVAIECVLFDIFQLDKDPFQYPKIPGAEDYLIEAAQADNPPSGTFYDPNHETPTERLQSLGVCEHWNNEVDRKYSRNLGNGNGIELLFSEDPTNCIGPIKRMQSNISGYSIKSFVKSGLIEYSIPKSTEITLALFDDQGRKITTLVDGFAVAGKHRIDLHHTLLANNMNSSKAYVLVLYRKEKGSSNVVVSSPVTLFRR